MVRSSSSALSFSALLAALRTFAGGTAQELEIAVDSLGEQEVDRFLALAARHRIVPLLARAMLPLSKKRVPPRLAVALQDAARAQASIALRQLQTVERLGAEFANARIDWLMMKGLALSQVAYGDPLLKAGIDSAIAHGFVAVLSNGLKHLLGRPRPKFVHSGALARGIYLMVNENLRSLTGASGRSRARGI